MLLESYAKQPEASGNARREAGQRIVDLYDAWHKAEPEKGYDATAGEWKAKLESAKP